MHLDKPSADSTWRKHARFDNFTDRALAHPNYLRLRQGFK
jgi:hypothetical protein